MYFKYKQNYNISAIGKARHVPRESVRQTFYTNLGLVYLILFSLACFFYFPNFDFDSN